MARSEASAEATPREGKLRWFLSSVVFPVTLLAALFFSGVHVGARNPQMWIARLLSWLLG